MNTTKKEAPEKETASFEGEVIGKTELTFAETERLLPPAVEFISQAGWDQVPKMLAVALAVHQVVDEQAERVHQLARALLERKQQKRPTE
jgi:molybdopterin biosynthesis enzyme